MNVSPERYGISSKWIGEMIEEWNAHGFAMHSVLLARRGEILYEGYWKPFEKSSLQRMNSVTKSFLGVAVGLLIGEGKLSLAERLTELFPEKLPLEVRREFCEVTIRDVLCMRTCVSPENEHWIRDRVADRAADYFCKTPTHPADTLFFYDTTAPFLLTQIVEDRTGKPFIEYLKECVLSKIGCSPEMTCVKGNDGYSWGDSGLLCTARDLFLLAELLRRGGAWNGEQLIDAAYVRDAISCQTPSNVSGWESYGSFGYGYQIWKTWDDGFAFFGMGDQIMICLPEKELIFVCTADNQGCAYSRMMILDAFDRNIRRKISDTPLPENEEAEAQLRVLTDNLRLVSLRGAPSSSVAMEICGRKIVLEKNSMGILWCAFHFDGQNGWMDWENASGVKRLAFSFGENALSTFPEEGYPDMEIRAFTSGNYYPCATSAAWQDARTLAIKTFMLGKHLGALYITVGFREEGTVGLRMLKNTNCFLQSYNGYAVGRFQMADGSHIIKRTLS